jgi:hypothetical protein
VSTGITKSPVGSGKPSRAASARSIKRIMKQHAGARGNGRPHSDPRAAHRKAAEDGGKA